MCNSGCAYICVLAFMRVMIRWQSWQKDLAAFFSSMAPMPSQLVVDADSRNFALRALGVDQG